jgi:ATP-dependent Clp protease ATP-binding subunit ClpA
MYERFTDRARKVMQLAHQEAARLNDEYVGTEHVLLGLVAEGAGVAASVLANLGIDLTAVRREVEKLAHFGRSETYPIGQLPHTPRTQKVIEHAIQEAEGLKRNYVGTEHLLLGLLRDEETVAAQMLMNFGLSLEAVRAEVFNILGCNAPTPGLSDAQADVVRTATRLEPEGAATYAVLGHPSPAMLSEAQLQLVRNRIELLTVRKEEFLIEQDSASASRCLDEAEALRQLLAWYEWIRGPR